MTKVYFDLLFSQPISGTKFHGGGEYMKSVFNNLACNFLDKCELFVLYNEELFIDDWILDIIKSQEIATINVKNADDIVDILKREDEEAVFFTGMIYMYANKTLPSNVYSIGTCHGLRPIEKVYDKEEWRYTSTFKGRVHFLVDMLFEKQQKNKARKRFEGFLQIFDCIITVSHHSEYSIKANLPLIAKNKELRVLYTPSKHVDVTDNQLKGNDDNYIMMISANRWLKNSYRGVVALDNLYENQILDDVKVRVYGNLPNRIRDRVKHKDKFEFYDYVSTEELESAYRNCKIFFYPTLNEGFGLPPMEAMKYGKTCAISAVCSLPEIYGNAVYYFNPYDIGEIQNRILMALSNPIDSKLVLQRVKSIEKKQLSDLNELCEIIVGGKFYPKQ